MSEENTYEEIKQEEQEGKVNTEQEQSSPQSDSKLCAVLSYFLLGIIWFFANEELKKDSFAKFHVKQAIILLVISVVGSSILAIIPILGWIALPFFGLATLVIGIIGIINALNGDKKLLPIIGPYADKYLKF